ncbi:hypothetical protein BBI09_05115 [Stutzerimonas xanthomarina]|nr:hypothetical protein BBI09_05115 [Stutzerimonas xanthomarina]
MLSSAPFFDSKRHSVAMLRSKPISANIKPILKGSFRVKNSLLTRAPVIYSSLLSFLRVLAFCPKFVPQQKELFCVLVVGALLSLVMSPFVMPPVV